MSVTTREPLPNDHDDSFDLPRSEARSGADWLDAQDHDSLVEKSGHGLVMEGGVSKYIEPLVIYKRLIIGSVMASILLGWLVLVLMPRSYGSTGKLQLLIGRESVGLDPSSTTSQTMLLQKTPEEDINSALEILGSRVIAEAVVDELGAENILNGYLPSGGDPEPPGLVKNIKSALSDGALKAYDLSGLRDKVSTRERAVTELQRKVAVFSPKKSSTLIIESESKSPQMAQAIVQSMVDNFMQRFVNVATTDGSFQFFETQSADAEQRLTALLDTRKEMLQREKLASVEAKYKSLTEQLSAIETEIITSEAQLKKTLAEIEDIKFNMSQLDPEIVATLQTQPDLTVSNMRTALYQAELEETRLTEMYQDDNPKLVAIRKQVESARLALDELESTSDSISKTPNPTLLKLEEELLKAKTAAVGLESYLNQNTAQKQVKVDEINRLLEFDNDLRQMDREIDVASKSLATLKEKEEQSRVIEGLRQQRISSISVAQPPSFVEKPISPKKPILAMAFVSLGLMTGIGLVYLREFTRRTIRRPEEVERLMKYPVLAELPHFRALARSGDLHQEALRLRRTSQMLDACQGIQSELMLNRVKSNEAVRQARRIGVIGVTDECGASSIAMALAMTCGERDGLSTTLIDLDARKGTISRGFGLAHNAERNRSRRRVNPESMPTQLITDEGLNLIGCKSELGQSLLEGNADEIAGTLDELGKTHEFIIVDFPPASRPGNSLTLAQQLDQIIVVIASDQTETKPAMKLIHQLEQANVDVVGIVVNKSKRYLARWLEGILG